MNTQPDFEKLLKFLEQNSVRYMIIGGYAVAYEEAEQHMIRGKYGDVEVNFIGKEDLLKNKKASGRPQDELDVKIIEG